jgi:tRNA-dihydrouridine synthase
MKTASSLGSDASAWSPRGAILAPMSGVSDAAFRRIAARFGASYVVTEMVGSEALIRRDAEARLRSEGAGLSPHVVQLVGRDAAAMAEAARLAEGAGAHVIDLNFGCPAKRVTGGLAGSALMREPDKALGIVEAVVRAVRVPVTVRCGLAGTRRP